MYLIRITLIGFIGSDAERKAANATNIAIFSLATKASWKPRGRDSTAKMTRARHATREQNSAVISPGQTEPPTEIDRELDR
jgi:hypothetical protein